MHKPMKTPNSRSGLKTEAKFAKNDMAVVAVVTTVALPALQYVQIKRSSYLSWCWMESRQKSV
jgi:hypothetical protein